jgi:hypothetical protein
VGKNDPIDASNDFCKGGGARQIADGYLDLRRELFGLACVAYQRPHSVSAAETLENNMSSNAAGRADDQHLAYKFAHDILLFGNNNRSLNVYREFNLAS